jgi:hypothetical protein
MEKNPLSGVSICSKSRAISCFSWKTKFDPVYNLLLPVLISTENKSVHSLLSLVSWSGVRLSTLGTSASIWPIVPSPDDR